MANLGLTDDPGALTTVARPASQLQVGSHVGTTPCDRDDVIDLRFALGNRPAAQLTSPAIAREYLYGMNDLVHLSTPEPRLPRLTAAFPLRPAYLDEMEWRFNNRENDYLFRDTLTQLVTAEALPYQELVS